MTPSRLWQFQLHSFSFAAPLARGGDVELLESLITSWIAAHPVTARSVRVSWNSYTISNRIENWAYAEMVLDRSWPAPIRASLRQQAAFLARRLEYDLRGNHLVRNAAALLLAASWIKAPEAVQWRRRALQALDTCLRRQVLPDGGHYERSPMYHLLVMEDFVQSLCLLRYEELSSPVRLRLEETLSRMADFAVAMQRGDGAIALMNDSVLGIAPAPRELLGRVSRLLEGRRELPQARPDRLNLFPDSGFAVVAGGGWRAIVDGGPLGPNEQPGHAHCDLGSVLADLEGEPILEDTGVFEYQAGQRRHYARSTAAHNTLQVDGLEQGDVWGEFRLGRRARPIALAAPNEHLCQLQFAWPGAPVRHKRTVELGSHGLRIDDEITGRGMHAFTLRWHFAPDVVPVRPDELSLFVSANGTHFQTHLDADWDWKLELTPFYPEFGRERRRYCLLGRRSAKLPVRVSTRFEALVVQ
ncbi:MAG TPA: alginate lyase family protein [Terriglobales bacterium]|nr:alginate lyase family protein [Terriglobales bacterium]